MYGQESVQLCEGCHQAPAPLAQSCAGTREAACPQFSLTFRLSCRYRSRYRSGSAFDFLGSSPGKRTDYRPFAEFGNALVSHLVIAILSGVPSSCQANGSPQPQDRPSSSEGSGIHSSGSQPAEEGVSQPRHAPNPPCRSPPHPAPD